MTHVVFENETFAVSPEHALHLGRMLGGNLRVERGGVRIVAVAGSLRLPDGSMLSIRSRKAPTASLLTWAAFAYPELSALRHVTHTREGGDPGDITSALARVFCVELHRAVQSSGLLRHYRRQRVVTPVVRGRIDFARLSRMGTNLAQVPCVVFARLPNTPLNALLAAAIGRICKHPLMRSAAGPSLGALSSMFAEVQPRVDPELASGKVALSRLEQPFAASLALALLIVHAHGLSSGTTTDGLSFIINLANLFERSVARCLTECVDEATPKRSLAYFRGFGDSVGFGGAMQIDVLLGRFDDDRPVVVDAKYKFAPDSANLQQTVTYCWMTGARQAVLVFPAGQLRDDRPYHYRGADGSTLVVHLVEFETDATSLDGWHAAGERLVARMRAAVRSHAEPTRARSTA